MLGKAESLLLLVLDAEQIHHIRVGQRLVHIVCHAASHFFVDARDERRRAAERDVRAELGQRPDVRPRHATVKDVPEDSNIEPADIALPFHHRKGVEQCLRGVLVRTVASVDHAAIHHAGEQVRRPLGTVPDNDDVGTERLERLPVSRNVRPCAATRPQR